MQSLEWRGNGYTPLICHGKVPVDNEWQKLPPETLLREPAPGESIGLRTGDGFIAIDVDVYDPTVSAQLIQYLETMIGTQLLQRVGSAPKTLIPFQCIDVPSKLISNKYTHSGSSEINAIEILSGGQQFIAQGVHPDTQQHYTWNGDVPPVVQLPTITRAQVEQFLTYYDLLALGSTWNLLPVVHGRRAPKQTTKEYRFNNLYNVGGLLEQYGWTSAGNNRYTRPGKKSGVSATTMDNTCYIFSSSTQFEEGTTLRPYDLINHYAFNGDDKAMGEHVTNTLTEHAATVFATTTEQPPATTPANGHQFAFNKSDNKVYEIARPAAPGMVIAAFKRAYGIYDDAWLVKPEPVITGIDYHPGREDIYYDDNMNGEVLNSFRFPESVAGTGSVDHFLDLTHKLWDKYTPYILDLLASIIQEPHRRIQVMPILLSGFGAGKDTWIDYFKAAIGHRNCTQETLANIAGVGQSEWGNWAKNSLLCVCSEAETTGKERYSLGSAIRDKITNSRLSVNLKGGKTETCEVFTTIIAFTNLNTAMMIPRNDRRIFIHRTDFGIIDIRERREFFGKCRAEIGSPEITGALFQYFKNRTITNDPYGHAPTTDYKQLLMQGTNDVEIVINELMDTHPSDIIVATDLRDKIRLSMGESDINEQHYNFAVRDLLTTLNKGKKMRVNGSMPKKVFSLRNHSKWLSRNVTGLHEELNR